MKKLLILLMLLAASVGADTVKVLYGLDAARQGYGLDTAVILHSYGETIDTLAWWHDGDSTDGIRVLDTFVTVSGTGTHYVYLKGVYDGYPDEWYVIEKWDLTLSTSATTGGIGDDRTTLYAVDSSGTPVYVAGVNLTFKDMSGNDIGFAKTKSGGYDYFDWTATDTVSVRGTKPGYKFTGMADGTDDSLIITGDQTDTLLGYNIAIGAPSGDSLCRVYGYTYSPEGGTAIEDATITWSMSGRNIYDVCNEVAIVKSSGSTRSDSNGLWTLDLQYSQCLQRSSTASTSDSTLYKIVITYPGGISSTVRDFNVPSADGVALTW